MDITPCTRILAASLTALALAGCGGGASSSAAPEPAGDAGQPAAVTIESSTYDPADVTVPAGTSVTWSNEDDAPHTVTFSDPALTSSDTLAPGSTFEATFPDAGSYPYTCTLHPEMAGTVTVS